MSALPIEILLGLAARGSLIVLAGAAIAALLHRGTAAARHLTWTATALSLLALPVVSALGFGLDLPLLPAGAPAATPDAIAAPAPPPAALAATPAKTGASPSRSLAALPERDLGGLIVLVYLAGCVLVAGRFALGVRQARAIARRAVFWRRAGGARVFLTDEVRAPVTWGLGRPVILLPRAARHWPPAELRRALLHERAHVERRDWPARVLARAVCGLHWFNPLVWWMERRALLEAERAADDRVLLATGGSRSYADQLLRLAAELKRPDLSLGVHLARKKHLACRIQAILDPRSRRTTMTRSKKLLVATALCLLLAGVSTIRLTAAPQEHRLRLSDELTEVLDELSRAVATGRLAETRRLLANGAEPSGAPLVLAASLGSEKLVETLLEAGADPDHAWRGRDHGFKRTPLTAAASHGHLEIVRLLLAAGAEVDRVAAGDGSALIEAARGGHAAVVEELLAASADPGLEVSGDGSPLIAAAAGGDTATVQRLLDAGARTDAWVPGDENALYRAIESGNADVVRRLLANGADFDAVWWGDGTPLIVAVRSGDPEIVDLLLAEGADVDRGVTGDGNALIEAARQRDLEVTLKLIAAGADVNAAVEGDGSPLIAAAGAGDLEIVRVLIESGARIDQIVPGDENALIQAAATGHLHVVRYLVEQGADVHVAVRNPYRGELRTALSMAELGGWTDVADYLRSVGARG